LRRGLGVVAARLWPNVDGGFGFGIGLLVLGSRVLEPPLSFQDRQPHVRSRCLLTILTYTSSTRKPTISLTYSGGV